MMKLSIFTTITNPRSRGDNYKDAIECYTQLADEVVAINGGDISDAPFVILSEEQNKRIDEVRILQSDWPYEFSWPFIGEQFQRGYEACTGDWVIHADIDFIFHERDFQRIREVLEANSNAPAVSFYKYQFILPDRYNLKSRLVIAVNKGKYGDRIKFDSGGDLCQPSLDGKQIKPEDVPEANIPFYNYEKLTKLPHQILDDAERMDRAYYRHFGKWIYRHNGMSSYVGWLTMMRGRFSKPQQHIPLENHPIYVQETIKNLKQDQWGYSGFGELGENDYAKSSSRSR